ncbi:hypothetical protein RCL1_009027 [Eukaryota sp. TZLM3-RCL]
MYAQNSVGPGYYPQPVPVVTYAQPVMMQQPQHVLVPTMRSPAFYHPGTIAQRFNKMPKKKKACCASFCCSILLLLIAALVYSIYMVSVCTSLSFDKETLVPDVSAGFSVSAPKATFRTTIVSALSSPRLRIIERNSRDFFPEPERAYKDQTNVYYWSPKNDWVDNLIGCHVVDFILELPAIGAVIDSITLDFLVGLAHHKLPSEMTYPIYSDVAFTVNNFHVKMEKETMFINKVSLVRGDFLTTSIADVTFIPSTTTNRGLKIVTRFGLQKLTARFATGASGYTIQQVSEVGKINLDVYGSSGQLKVDRKQNSNQRQFTLNGVPENTPYDERYGGAINYNNNFDVKVSGVRPGEVEVVLH